MPTPNVDKGLCNGTGYCWTNCPAIFSQDTDGLAKTNGLDCSHAPVDPAPGSCSDLVNNCPTGAIYLT